MPLHVGYFHPRVSEIGLLTSTSARSSETGWSMPPLKNLCMFNQPAKWWKRLAIVRIMRTNSRCMVGIMKRYRLHSCRVTASNTVAHAPARGSRPERGPSRRVPECGARLEGVARRTRRDQVHVPVSLHGDRQPEGRPACASHMRARTDRMRSPSGRNVGCVIRPLPRTSGYFVGAVRGMLE